MKEERCSNCIHFCELEKLDYSKGGCEHIKMDGFACDLFTDTIFTDGKRIVNWMFGCDPDNEQCECWHRADEVME